MDVEIFNNNKQFQIFEKNMNHDFKKKFREYF